VVRDSRGAYGNDRKESMTELISLLDSAEMSPKEARNKSETARDASRDWTYEIWLSVARVVVFIEQYYQAT
jgi:hypothetical protein